LPIKDTEETGIRHTWADTNTKRLENLLNFFVTGFINAAVDRRARPLKRERKEREWEERRRRAEEEER
jgi:hypothetical protein